MKKTPNIIRTYFGVLAVIGAIVAVCVTDGSEHETVIRLAGAATFAMSAFAYETLKGERR